MTRLPLPLTVLTLAVCLLTELQAQTDSKRLWRTRAHNPRSAILRSAQTDDPLLVAFAQADELTGAATLTSHNCTVYDQTGDIFIIGVPLSELDSLEADRAIRRIEARAVASALLDSVGRQVRADAAHSGRGLPQAFTGEGVALGIIDVGIDLGHPTFAESPAPTALFWDFLAPHDGSDTTLPVGRLTRGEADCASLVSTDIGEISHGTHTLGIAAGCGYDSPYRGIAPGATRLVVSNAVSDDLPLIDSLLLYRYTNATDALAFKTIFREAEALGKPCVISLSEGYPPMGGATDSLYSAYLGRLVGPGRIIVAAAGNASTGLNYVAKPADKPRSAAYIYSRDNCAELVSLSRGDARLTISIPDYGLTFATDHCPATCDTTLWQDYSLPGGPVSVSLRRTAAAAPWDSLVSVYIERDSILGQAPLTAAVIEGTGEGAVSLATPATFISGGDYADGEATHNVNAPACFPAVIAVGATTHRRTIPAINDPDHFSGQEGPNDGCLAFYSSVGPTLDGRMKPEVVAPGSSVISAYGADYVATHTTGWVADNAVARFDYRGRTYGWDSAQGTSMAAPVAAGAIALWLEACPTLTPDDITATIAATATHYDPALPYPNPQYGYGEIDAYAGLLHILGLSGIKEISRQHLTAATIRPATGKRLTVCFDGQPPAPVRLTAYTPGGKLVLSRLLTLAADGLTDEVALPSGVSGIVAIQLTTSEGRQLGSTLVRVR